MVRYNCVLGHAWLTCRRTAVLLAYVVFIMVFYIPVRFRTRDQGGDLLHAPEQTGLSYLALLRRGLGKAGRPTSSNRPHDSAQAPSSSLSLVHFFLS